MLFQAAKHTRTEKVKLLIEYGADVNFQDIIGKQHSIVKFFSRKSEVLSRHAIDWLDRWS
ncbi:ankyrin repeat domain-containing protein [Ferrimonas balearica]|uniref:ankyrin repeat domain-containing protein n=1 Tax=Ferrimonas balearica TaxID=44012 RepID=UPI001C991A5A|nr:hypothetical protein [Ferrimonas balearica]